jgi:predicted TIM-barrel fold metal-dependent hydrolase
MCHSENPMNTHSRRDFLKTAVVASTGVVSSCSLEHVVQGADPAAPLYNGPIIDTHEHLWNLKELRLPWVNALTGKPREILGHDYLPADYAEATKGLNVTRSVYMEVDVAVEDQVKEADYVIKTCTDAKTPMVAAVISGRPASDGFKDYLDRFQGNRYIKGLRQVLHTGATPPRYCLEDKFVKGIQLLGDRKLSFDVCVKNDQIDFATELVERCPQTRFILDHCGNPHIGTQDLAGWERALAKLANAKNRNVICKVSGVYGNVTAADWPTARLTPIVRKVIDLFGWDRVIFAGDWPVVNLGASFKVWGETVRQIVRADSAENQKKLFHDNAVRFYGLG